MELLLVTGMSGAGKTRALQTLEDIGFFCVDNLPPQLMLYLLDTEVEAGMGHEKMAVTVDIRCEELLPGMEALVKGLRGRGIRTQVLFLDAANETLKNRYKETRRLHPLILRREAVELTEALDIEREKLAVLRQLADTVIDTSHLHSSQLREKIVARYADENYQGMTLEFVSFGYKYGILADADLVFDVRCLPNPFYVEELRNLTGADRAVRDYVMSTPEARELFERIRGLLEFSLPLYQKEGKMHLVIAFGCTGGQHRSLAFAGMMKEYFEGLYPQVKLTSRDARENRYELISRTGV